MKRLPLEPPSDYYDERIEEIDEEICQSNNNPGFPTKQLVANLSKNIPILKSFEKDDKFYSVTFVRQFRAL